MRQKLTILIILSLLALAGCGGLGTDKAKELELKEKELALKEKELELTNKNPKADDSNKKEKSEKTETPKPLKKVEPPSGATVAIINASDVVARSQPSLTAKKVALLKKGQKVYVIGVSDNLVVWEGESYTMKNVQLENGQKGWVLNRFIDEN
ncbi:MAG: SH3 domain-containing protein [Pyrinomonadaceae bacterium]|nr:SH3 domain-containing protein [Pyrinomonadaceae bacterium]